MKDSLKFDQQQQKEQNCFQHIFSYQFCKEFEKQKISKL